MTRDLGPIIDDHPFQNLAKREADLVAKIDARGGWPVEAKSLVVRHGTQRDCYFSERESVNDPYNTSIMTADDYYWAKLSQKRKDEFSRKQIRDFLMKVRPS